MPLLGLTIPMIFTFARFLVAVESPELCFKFDVLRRATVQAQDFLTKKPFVLVTGRHSRHGL